MKKKKTKKHEEGFNRRVIRWPMKIWIKYQLVIKRMQIKILTFLLTYTGWWKIKNLIIPSAGEDVDENSTTTLENSFAVS